MMILILESWKIASKWYTINKNLKMVEKLFEKGVIIFKNNVDFWITVILK